MLNSEALTQSVDKAISSAHSAGEASAHSAGIAKVNIALTDNSTVMLVDEPPKSINVPSANDTSHIKLGNSKETLERHGFDPLVNLIKMYDVINRQIAEEERALHQDLNYYGKPRRYHRVALNQLVATQQKLLTDMLRYGYARVPETTDVNLGSSEGLTINVAS